MAKFQFNDYGQASDAAFMGDFGNREHILAGGIQLSTAAAFGNPTDGIVPAGTVVGCTKAEKASGTAFGPAVDTDEVVYILVADVDLDLTKDADVVRHGSLIKTNFLPGFGALSAAVQALIHAQYETVRG